MQDPRWGLLIKPKNRGVPWQWQNRHGLRDLAEQALATGRTSFLNARLSPADAAAVSDFAVGVDVSSAVVVAGLAGHRAIHLDYIDQSQSPFSEWAHLNRAGQDRLVFNDPETLWASLNRYFDEPDSSNGLGLMEDPLLSNIDPFRDGQAGKRVGQYIGWFLEALEQGLGRDAALAQSTRRYANEWGESSVAKGLAGLSAVSPEPEKLAGLASDDISMTSLETPD